jgi:hypothetical protein
MKGKKMGMNPGGKSKTVVRSKSEAMITKTSEWQPKMTARGEKEKCQDVNTWRWNAKTQR